MKRRRRVPVVFQNTSTDCAAACLAMILQYYGKPTSLTAIRAEIGTGRDGANALQLITAAKVYGLEAYGIPLTVDQLEQIDVPAILHWESRHFVVVERVSRKTIDIVDP